MIKSKNDLKYYLEYDREALRARTKKANFFRIKFGNSKCIFARESSFSTNNIAK